MRVLIVSSFSEGIASYLASAGHEVKECLSTDLAPRITEEYAPEVVVFSEDVSEIPPVGSREALRDIASKARVVFLAEKESPVVPYAAALGVRDFVFLPAGPAAILYRLENPAKPEEAAAMLDKLDLQIKKEKDVVVQKYRASLFGMFFGNKKQKKGHEDMPKNEELTPKNSKPHITSLLNRMIMHKPGIIKNGDFLECSFKTPAEADSKCDAVVIPAAWGIKAVRDFQRDPRFKAIPLVVIKGNRKFLHAGADMCVKKLSPKVIEEATALSRRYKKLWEKAEIDQLTGLYKKEFVYDWISAQENREEPCFSIAMLDIDHFKAVNDTYGHQAGDAVLASLGAFLKVQTRSVDVAARYGGEEFIIGLPNTPVQGAQVLIDRLLSKWAQRDILLPSDEKIKCTFSAGVAEYKKGADVIAAADTFLYQAKDKGRNRVESTLPKANKVLLLGQKVSGFRMHLLEQGFEIVSDPADAKVVVADFQSYVYAPSKPLVVLGTGTIADFTVKKAKPEAKIVKDIDGIIEALGKMFAEPKQPKPRNLKILPGKHSGKGHSLALHSGLYIVCPSRPGQAGEVAAQLVKNIENCALVCAAPESTGALALGIPERDLICSDWRIPGSDAPISWGGVIVWPVDPFKFLNIQDVSAHALVEQIKSKFDLVIVDCAGNLDLASRAPKTDGAIVLYKEGDTSDTAASYWLKNYAGNNVFVMSPSEAPDILSADGGFIVGKSVKQMQRKSI